MLRGVVKSTEGSTLPFVAMMLVVSLGLVGLAYDFGIQFLLLAELQKAADAAAVAGASQLDRYSDQDEVAARVAEAIAGSAITSNETRLSDVPGAIVIASTRLLHSLPADDDDPITDDFVGPPYSFVEVTTQVASTSFSFLQIFGANVIESTATAVGGQDSMVCNVTPIAVCNPFESEANIGAPFTPGAFIGHQIYGNTNIHGHGLVPGEIQWLQPPNVGNGAIDLAEALASGSGTGSCVGTSSGVDLRPGEVASVRTALNTRFDIYENPFFGGAANRDPRFAPAENVTKGFMPNGSGTCDSHSSSSSSVAALPRDTDLSSNNRVGNGQWDCQSYWSVNHPGVMAPAGCGNASSTSLLRFEIYQYEIANGLIPNNEAIGGENGNPVCSTELPVPSNTSDPEEFQYDRRVVTMAVLNCLEHGLSNNETNVPIEGFMSGFLTEPTDEEHANNSGVYIEIVGSNLDGQEGYAPVTTLDSTEVVR